MTIQVLRNQDGNCITFRGTANPAYFNACLSAQVDPTRPDTINIINDVASAASDTTIYEFYQIPFTEFRDADNNPFATAADTAAYITAQGNVLDIGGATYLGVWAADVNNPTLSDGDTVDIGDFYFVSVSGDTLLGGVSEWKQHDRVMWNGSAWQKIEAAQLVNASTISTLLSSQTAIFADGEHGGADPLHQNPGWYYKNTENNKINWYFFGDTIHTAHTLGDLGGWYAVVDFRNATSVPYWSVYTQMQVDGNDAGVWYRSRINYNDESLLASTLGVATGRYLLHAAGMDVSGIEPLLPRIALGTDSATTEGPQANAEEISYMALSTSSGLPADTNEFVVEKVGYQLGDYINEYLLTSPPTTGASVDDTNPATVSFVRDATDTTILADDGKQWGVNTVHAVSNGDGTVDIKAVPGNQLVYNDLTASTVTVSGASYSSDHALANALNALFSVNPLGAGGDYAPTYPLLTGTTVTGNFAEGITPTTTKSDGTTLHTYVRDSDSSGHGARFWSNETINESGEFYTVKITGNGRFLIGFADGTTDSTASGTADDLEELANNSGTAHSGLLWSQGIYDYGSYTAPWTWYGSSSNGSYGPGWTSNPTNMMRYNNDVQVALATADDSDGALLKAGIDNQGYLSVWYYDSGRSNDWILCSRRAYTTDGSKVYHLVVKLWDGNTTLVEMPEITATDPAAPVLNYRYIESPDGSFHYPLFATTEEAEYVDEQNGGAEPASGDFRYDSLVYVDEPTMTTWYMPVTGGTVDGASAPVNTAEITYVEIPTNADNLYAPAALSLSDLSFDENELVNAQIVPQDTIAVVSGLPAGLSYAAGYVTGTTRYVAATQVHTVTVERSNAYGTTSQTFDLTINDNASMGNLTNWSEVRSDSVQVQPDLVLHYSPEAIFDAETVLSPGDQVEWTQTNASPEGGPGQYLQMGVVSPGVDKTVATLGNVSAHWDLKMIIWTNSVNHSLGVTGWTDNSIISAPNAGAQWKLTFEADGGPLKLYKDGALLLTSADNYTGDQTLTVAVPAAYSTSTRLPALTFSTIGAGSTTPPSGFQAPLTAGQMDDSSTLGSDAVATLDMVLRPNHRVILPQSFVESNILPHLPASPEKGYFAVPKTTANWGSVDLHNDFDAVIRWEGQSGDKHKISQTVGNSASANHLTINSASDSFYDYAIEWDGTNLHVIACNINSLNTQPGVSNGGVFSRVYTYLNYDAVRTGDLPLVFATKSGGSLTLTTSGIQSIRIPFGARDILVSESSSGNGNFGGDAGDYEDGQQHGNSGASFHPPTVNAGYTYNFIYDNSVEAGDYMEILLQGTTTTYNTGVSTYDDTANDGYRGINFAIPSDAPPLDVRFYNSFSGAFDTQRPLTISGSTYVTPVTDVSILGPSSAHTGNLASNNLFFEVVESLGAGQRIVMSADFLNDLAQAADLASGNQIHIGLKDVATWAENNSMNSGSSLGDRWVRLRSHGGSWQITLFAGTSQIASSSFSEADWPTPLFLELTNSGDNFRMGYDVTPADDVNSTPYGDWSATKQQTGDQGYGLTSAKVLFRFIKATGTDFDLSDVDWTALSEISIPTAAAALTTPWNYAVDFSGTNERMQQEGGGSVFNDPIRQTGTAIAMPTTGFTSSDTLSGAWATAIVFRHDGNASNQVIWGQCEGTGSGDDNVMLSVNASNEVLFTWGRDGAISEKVLGTFSPDTWYGIYIDYNGFCGAAPTVSEMADAIRFRLVALDTGVVTAVTGDFDVAARMTRTLAGRFYLGGRDSNRSFHGKIGSMVVTSLGFNAALPGDAEIAMMVRDPQQWLTDYKVGNAYRVTGQTYNNADFQLNDIGAARNTQVWLMGDGTSDSYAVIRNSVHPADQNFTAIRMISMVSNDIQNVTITGLS